MNYLSNPLCYYGKRIQLGSADFEAATTPLTGVNNPNNRRKSMFEWFTKKKKIQALEVAVNNIREYVTDRDSFAIQRTIDTAGVLQVVLDVLGIKTIWGNPDEEESALLKKGNYKLVDRIGERKFYAKSSSCEGKR